jgi:hypothetical protein
LPKDEVRSLGHISFVVKFEKYLVKTKSECYLSKIMFDISKFKYLFSTAFGFISPKPGVSSPKSLVSSQISTPRHSPIRIIAARFSPLVLLAQLHDLP